MVAVVRPSSGTGEGKKKVIRLDGQKQDEKAFFRCCSHHRCVSFFLELLWRKLRQGVRKALCSEASRKSSSAHLRTRVSKYILTVKANVVSIAGVGFSRLRYFKCSNVSNVRQVQKDT